MLANVDLKALQLGGAVVTELAAKRFGDGVDQHVAIPDELVLELALANVAVVEELPLALPRLQTILVVNALHFPVFHVVRLAYVFQEVFDV